MTCEETVQEFEDSIGWDEALQDLKTVHDGPAVYAITTSAPIQRLNAQSRILYIGKTGCLGGSSDRCRLYAYRYAPNGQHGSRVKASIAKVQEIGHTVSLRFKRLKTESEAKTWEERLLEEYANEHLELPPFNRRT
jgi:hypothetical protein